MATLVVVLVHQVCNMFSQELSGLQFIKCIVILTQHTELLKVMLESRDVAIKFFLQAWLCHSSA